MPESCQERYDENCCLTALCLLCCLNTEIQQHMYHGKFGIKSPQMSVTRLSRPAKALSSAAKSCLEEGTCPLSIDRVLSLLHENYPARSSQVGAQSIILRYTSDGACSSGGNLGCFKTPSTPLLIVASVASVASRLRRLGCHQAWANHWRTHGMWMLLSSAIIHRFTWHHRVAKHIICPKGFGER